MLLRFNNTAVFEPEHNQQYLFTTNRAFVEEGDFFFRKDDVCIVDYPRLKVDTGGSSRCIGYLCCSEFLQFVVNSSIFALHFYVERNVD